MILCKATLLTGLLVLFALGGMPLSAQSDNSEAQKNIKIVLDWWREMIVGGHVELAPKYVAEDYVEHNPNLPSGRAALVDVVRKMPRPVQAWMSNPPAQVFANGDYVVLIWERIDKDPADPSKTYKHYSFNMVRLQDGKIQEHWDAVQKTAPVTK